MELLKAENLKKYYGSGHRQVRALDGVDLSIEEGEIVAIVGTSGSGKSTLLNMLGGLDYPTEGEVIVRGNRLRDMKEEALTIFRRRNIGFVFQNYNLLPLINVYENILLPLHLDGAEIDKPYLTEIIRGLKIEDRIWNMPDTLSGGEQQRVGIARAMSAKPAVILADEPTGNLDSKTGLEVISLLKMTARTFNQTVAIVTHDEEVAQIADRIIRIEDGRLC